MNLLFDSIYSCLGINDFRLGKHTLRDENNSRTDEIWVNKCWYATIAPSFHPVAVIAYVSTRDSEFRGKRHEATSKGAIAISSADNLSLDICLAANNLIDSFSTSLQSINLTLDNQKAHLDGVAYNITTLGSELSASMKMLCPTHPSLKKIESELFHFADTLNRIETNKTLSKYLKTWRTYIAK